MVDSVRNMFKRRPPTPPPPKKPLLDLMPLAEYVIVILFSFLLYLVSYAYLVYAVFNEFGGLHKRYQPGDSGKKSPNMNNGNVHVIMCGLTPFFTTNGVLVFRVWCCYNRQVAKILHTLFFTIPIPLIIVSFSYIKNYYGHIERLQDTSHLWTYHSWMGFGFLTLFFILVISGIAVFEGLALYDRFDTMEIRARFVTYHNIFGVMFFLMSVGVIISGVTEYAGIPNTSDTSPSNKSVYAEFDNIFAFSGDDADSTTTQDPLVSKYYFTRHAAARTATLLYVCSTIPVMYALAKEEFRYRGRIILTMDRDMRQT